jgi:TolB-like protein
VLRRATIEKIVSSLTLTRAPQLQRLLLWIADRSLTPGQTTPSEKEIAESILGRKDFDPRSDSLVRKEMSRLRQKLERYYASEGKDDEILVTSEGGYTLQFARIVHARSNDSGPCWLVLPIRSAENIAEVTNEFYEELLLSLGRIEGNFLVSPTTSLAYRGRYGDVCEMAASCGADLIAEGSLTRTDDLFQARIWLVAAEQGQVIRAEKFSATSVVYMAKAAASWLAGHASSSGELTAAADAE